MKETYETRSIAVRELRAEGDGAETKIRGYAALYNVLSDDLGGFREQIATGAFTRAAKEDDVRALVNHDPSLIIGRTKAGTLTLRDDDTGLWFELTPPDTQVGRDIVTSIRRGDIDQMSFGFRVAPGGDQWMWANGTALRTVKDVELFDISPVTYPAYPQTSVSARSQVDALKKANGQAAGGTDQSDVQALARRQMLMRLEIAKRS